MLNKVVMGLQAFTLGWSIKYQNITVWGENFQTTGPTVLMEFRPHFTRILVTMVKLMLGISWQFKKNTAWKYMENIFIIGAKSETAL